MDIYVDPAVHGRESAPAVRTLARHLIADHGHHRLTIDPQPTTPPPSAYTKVGFRPVGVQRRRTRHRRHLARQPADGSPRRRAHGSRLTGVDRDLIPL
jgi:hypothetical protein